MRNVRLLFLLLGEKVRMRAGVKHKIRLNDRPHPGPLLRGEGEMFAALTDNSRDDAFQRWLGLLKTI
jgi:hypothetical protein